MPQLTPDSFAFGGELMGVDQAAAQGWQGGIMSFEFPSADGAWIQAAKGSSLQ